MCKHVTANIQLGCPVFVLSKDTYGGPDLTGIRSNMSNVSYELGNYTTIMVFRTEKTVWHSGRYSWNVRITGMQLKYV